MKKILYGISGIGTGHTNRQLPLIQYFARKSHMVIFAYGESYRFYNKFFRNVHNVSVMKIAIPFVAGNRDGLDFLATARVNKNQDFLTLCCKALAKTAKILGKPDLVITDYEPLSAQYAYAYDAPLVTIDQQSKYLCGSFPSLLSGQGYKDEVMRLRMFFPRANARIACSFFKVQKKPNAPEVLIVPPTLKDSILSLKRNVSKKCSILVYISSQREFVQTIENVVKICVSQKNVKFHIFVRGLSTYRFKKMPENVLLYEHGDSRFYTILQECQGIVSTAGHMLLSEAMYLGIPVYAIPLAVYEQQMNAYVINKHKFGLSHSRFEKQKLSEFIRNIDCYAQSIKNDTKILLRRQGQKEIIKYLEKCFL